MPDKAVTADVIKHVQPMGKDMVIQVFGNKFHLAKNEKMSDGKLSFDYWGIQSSN